MNQVQLKAKSKWILVQIAIHSLLEDKDLRLLKVVLKSSIRNMDLNNKDANPYFFIIERRVSHESNV